MNRHSVAKKAKRLGGRLGGFWLGRYFTRAMPRVFMYHRFSAQPQRRRMHVALFEQQLRAIAAEFTVMTMREVVQRYRADGELPARAAVITVDDGHRDFYDLAFPVLRRLGLPATLYVTSGFAAGHIWLWPDRLEHVLFDASVPDAIAVGRIGLLSLATESERWRAWNAIVERCIDVYDADRLSVLEDVEAACGTSRPERPTAEFQAINWDQAIEMARDGVEIGAHTCTHPILSRIPQSNLRDEVEGSKLDIECAIQQPVVSFCYPNGRAADFNESVKSRVRSAGFTSAVAAYFADDDWQDLFEIKRIPASSDPDEFRNKLSGIDQLAARLKHRVVA